MAHHVPVCCFALDHRAYQPGSGAWSLKVWHHSKNYDGSAGNFLCPFSPRQHGSHFDEYIAASRPRQFCPYPRQANLFYDHPCDNNRQRFRGVACGKVRYPCGGEFVDFWLFWFPRIPGVNQKEPCVPGNIHPHHCRLWGTFMGDISGHSGRFLGGAFFRVPHRNAVRKNVQMKRVQRWCDQRR